MDVCKGKEVEIVKDVEGPTSPLKNALISESKPSDKEEGVEPEKKKKLCYSADDEGSYEGEDNNNEQMSPVSGKDRMIDLTKVMSMCRRLRAEYDILDTQRLCTRANRKRMIKIGKLLEAWEFKDSDYDSQHWAEIRTVHFHYFRKMKTAWVNSEKKKN